MQAPNRPHAAHLRSSVSGREKAVRRSCCSITSGAYSLLRQGGGSAKQLGLGAGGQQGTWASGRRGREPGTKPPCLRGRRRARHLLRRPWARCPPAELRLGRLGCLGSRRLQRRPQPLQGGGDEGWGRWAGRPARVGGLSARRPAAGAHLRPQPRRWQPRRAARHFLCLHGSYRDIFARNPCLERLAACEGNACVCRVSGRAQERRERLWGAQG